MTEVVVRKASALIPVSFELLFDVPREPIVFAGMAIGGWSQPTVKEWLRRGHGMGREATACRWPRPTLAQLRLERIERNRWLKALDSGDEDE